MKAKLSACRITGKVIFFILLLSGINCTGLFAQSYIEQAQTIGSSGNDSTAQMIVDAAGNSYLLSTTSGNDFPVTKGTVASGTGVKSTLTKLGPGGNLLWSRYLPMSATGIGATDFQKMSIENGVIYLLGYTTSNNVAGITNGSVFGGGPSDAFFAKLDTDGNGLFASYLGGNGRDASGLDMVVVNGEAYITFASTSSNIPITTGPAFTAPVNRYDHVVMKLNSTGSVSYATYTGTSVFGAPLAGQVSLAVENNEVFLSFVLNGVATFPTTDGSTPKGGSDLVVIRLGSTGNVIYSTIIGGSSGEIRPDIAVHNGEVYLVGFTDAYNYPSTDGTVKPTPSDGSSIITVVVTKLGTAGTILYSGFRMGLSISLGSDPKIKYREGAVYLFGTCYGSSGLLSVVPSTGTGGNYLLKINPATGSVQQSILFGPISTFNLPVQVDFEVVNGDVYTVNPVAISTKIITTDGSSGGEGYYVVRHNSSGQMNFASFLPADIQGIGEFAPRPRSSIAFKNGKLYVLNSAETANETSNSVVTAISAPPKALYDLYHVIYAFCPPMPVGNTISPLSQTNCKEGFTTAITGNKVSVPSISLPLLYRNGVAEQQAEIKARYQWQSAGSPAGPWTNIVGSGILQDYQPPSSSVNRYYRRLALAPLGCVPELVSTSAVAEVLVNTDQAPAVTGAVFNTCAGSAVNINVSVSGGTPAYTYSWDNGIGSTTQNATVTPASNSVYTVTVADSKGCQQIGQAIVNAYTADAGPATATVCAGKQVRIGSVPPAGLAGVTYSWSPSTGLDDPTAAQPLASPASTTTYTLTMTIPKSGGGTCSTQDNITINVVAAPTNSNFAGPDKTLCKGGTVSLGIPAEAGFGYTWVPGNYLSASNISNPNFNAGTEFQDPNPFSYTAYAIKNGCTFSDEVTISTIQAHAGIDGCGPRTVGIPDPAPGVTGKIFLWEKISGPGSFTGPTNTSTTTVSASVSGSTIYRVTVSHNGTSCVDEVEVQEPCLCPNVDIKVVSSHTCPSLALGSVTLEAVPAGLASFGWIYSWSSSTGMGISSTSGTSISLTDNIEKDITLTVTKFDNPSLSCSKTIHVNNPAWAAPVFSAPDQSICPAQSVSIGQPPIGGYTYLWSGGNINGVTISNPSVSPAFTTAYSVVVTDVVSGCTTTDNVTVNLKPLINDPGPDWVTCSNAMVTLGTPAIAGYTYSWSPAVASYQGGTTNTSAQPKVLVASTQDFTLTVTDQTTGCSKDSIVHITIDNTNTLPAMNNPAICAGTSVQIGNSALPGVTYSWSPATALSSTTAAQPFANPTVTTTYTVVATYYDVNGNAVCSKTGNVTVTVNAPQITMSDASVCASAGTYDLSTGVTVTGATSFSWSPAVLVNSPNTLSTTVKANPTSPTTFTLTATDINGCSASASRVISPTTTAPNAGSSSMICLGNSVTLGDPSNTGIVSWSVSPAIAGTLSSASAAAPVYTPAAGDVGKRFTFIISRTEGGCTNSASVNIDVKGLALSAMPAQTICNNSTVTIGVPAQPGISYQWTPVSNISDPTAATTTVKNVTGNTVFTLFATDTYGCTASANAVIGVNPSPAPVVSIPDITTCLGTPNPAFAPSISPAGGPYTYTWSPVQTLNDPYIVNAKATPGNLGSSTFNLTVIDANGCQGASTVKLNVVSCHTVVPIYISAFTAQSRGCDVRINWTAESAENFSHFVLERSVDGIQFEAIGIRRFEKDISHYTYTDIQPGNGKWFYRLKLVDLDLSFTYSDVEAAKLNCDAGSMLSVYPNPVKDRVYIRSSKAIRRLTLFTLTGQPVLQFEPAQNQPGIIEVQLGGKTISGLYLLHIISKDGTAQHIKVMID